MFKILKSFFFILIPLLNSTVFAQIVNFTDPTSTPTNYIPDLAISGTSSQITTSSSGKYVYAIWNENEAGPIQTAFSHDFGQTWQNPNHTPTNTIPNLASLGFNPQITTNNSGKNIYAVWTTENVVGGSIQIAFSNDFGLTWQNPNQTPTNTIPDLAISGFKPQITTNSSGEYVYAIWEEIPNGAIQTAFSDDAGKTWKNPNITPTNTIPNLAASGGNPQITTDSSGKYIYAIWEDNAIQIALSDDFGNTWKNPTSTPTNLIPDLATSGKNPQITTNSSGEYVYAIWIESTTNAIQTAFSDDFGHTWKNPNITPTNTIPDLATSGITPQITTNSSGQHVYAIWDDNAIQTAFSDDYGSTWKNPNTTPTNIIPDLANTGLFPQITTDSSGKYIYAIWMQETNYAIQTAFSEDFGLTWKTPNTTPTNIIPDLAILGTLPQIKTNNSGEYIYAIWQKNYPGIIQIARGSKTISSERIKIGRN